MTIQNRRTFTIDVPASEATALSHGRFVTYGSSGLQYAAENGDAMGILLDDVEAGVAKTVSIDAIANFQKCEVHPVDTVAFAKGDLVAVGANGLAKKAVSGTSVQMGIVQVAKAASSGKVLSFIGVKKGANA